MPILIFIIRGFLANYKVHLLVVRAKEMTVSSNETQASATETPSPAPEIVYPLHGCRNGCSGNCKVKTMTRPVMEKDKPKLGDDGKPIYERVAYGCTPNKDHVAQTPQTFATYIPVEKLCCNQGNGPTGKGIEQTLPDGTLKVFRQCELVKPT